LYLSGEATNTSIIVFRYDSTGAGIQIYWHHWSNLQYREQGETHDCDQMVVGPEKTTDLAQVTAKHYHLKVVSSTPHHLAGFKLTTLVVIRTDCTGSCKSNYHLVTIMSLPLLTILQIRPVMPVDLDSSPCPLCTRPTRRVGFI
jgi:hypothetical protein